MNALFLWNPCKTNGTDRTVSIALVFFANLEAIRDSPTGRYVREHMTRAAEAVRLMGMNIMSVGAWQHQVSMTSIEEDLMGK